MTPDERHAEFARHWSPARRAADVDAIEQNEGVREHESALDGRHSRG